MIPAQTPPARVRVPAPSGVAAPRSPAVEAALSRSLFVIPSINGGPLLRRMLPTLRLPPHTVVVLDQGSIDDTEAVCRAAGVRVVQLGHPHTYTEAGNIGAGMAREAGCDFVFVSNNDIAFTTDVGAELLAEMLEDPHLGIVAPSQVIVDEKAGQRILAHRAEWHLDTMLFTHEVRGPSEDVGRLEADLCELTCAAVRMSAIDEIGFLDDDFGFYYEDADFCFRLRQAGYSCAYLPRSQIEHFTSSTFSAGLSGRKRAYMAKNVELFAGKHLGYGFGRLVRSPGSGPASGGLAHRLPGYLQRFGLLHRGRPALVCGDLGTAPLDYLHADWTDGPPAGRTRDRLSGYRGLVATTAWGRQRLREAGFDAVGLAPHGIETDVFHPWVAPARPYDEPTLLWSGQAGDEASLGALLEAWRIIRAERPDARLIVMGTGVAGCLDHAPANLRRWHDQTIADYPEDRISVRELARPLSEEAWARLCRGVDVVVSTRLHPDAGLVQAMACGTVAVFASSGWGAEIAHAGALVYPGAAAGAGGTGRWRPDVDLLASRLRQALDLDGRARRALARRALPLVRSRLTWRSTCAGLNAALKGWQEPSRLGATLRRRWEADMDLLTADGREVVYEAGETAHDGEAAVPVRARPAPPPPAATRAPTEKNPDAGGAVPVHPRRLARTSRRIWRTGWAVAGLRRRSGTGAAIRMLGRALLRRARARIGILLVRFGLLPRRS